MSYAKASTRLGPVSLATLLIACGSDPVAAVQDDYVVQAAAGCNVTRDGAAGEPLYVSGEIVIEEPFDSSPEGCAAVATIQAYTCDGCAPTNCQLCLHNVRDEAGIIRAELGRAYATDIVPSCSLVDRRGGLSSDLLFDGSDITGELTHSATNASVTLSFSVTGTSSIGLSGTDVPSVASCQIAGARAE
jgi:hypothetical protein